MIRLSNVSLALGGRWVLSDISFEINRGEYVGLIGPNGAGKTSLLKTILGLYSPSKGTVDLQKGITIGYVPQKVHFSGIVSISVAEALQMSGSHTQQEMQNALQKVELDASFLEKTFHSLSGGQQQRVILARALCHLPDMLLFDEPLTGIDHATKASVYGLLSRLSCQEGITMLFVSHEIDQITADCHRVLCLNNRLHTGCHPMDFANGRMKPCPVLDSPKAQPVLPIHHHHRPVLASQHA